MSNEATIPLYRRVLLKMSGEALLGDGHVGIDPMVLDRYAKEVHQVVELGVQVGLVIGGGNLFRGAALSEVGLGRVTGDQMGMLATVMNSLALRDAFQRAGIDTQVMSAIPLSGVLEHYNHRSAIQALEAGQVVIFAAGIGNPFFSTDSAASLRGIEVEADIVLKATKVDGVYTADPVKDPSAVRYDKLTYDEALNKNLAVMDSTAICLCRDHRLPLRVFNINKPNILKSIVLSENEGTLIQPS